jgi:hypothetical protein
MKLLKFFYLLIAYLCETLTHFMFVCFRVVVVRTRADLVGATVTQARIWVVSERHNVYALHTQLLLVDTLQQVILEVV